MGCAVITGASSGLGMEFAIQLSRVFPSVQEIWLIARRAERLEALASRLPGLAIRCISADLTDTAGLSALQAQLEESGVQVELLINCAGCGYLDDFDEAALDTQLRMVDLNVRALTAVTRIVLDHMPAGGRIINISSIASFVPTPRMTVYSASKSYVSAFSRGLNEELRKRGISVTAVCPGPMRTEFLALAGITGRSKAFELLPYCDPAAVAENALAAAKARRAVYTPRALYKFYRVLSGIVPHALLVKITKT